MATNHTFGTVLNWSWVNYPEDWYGRLRATFSHVRRATQYYADRPESLTSLRKLIDIDMGNLTKNSTRQQIVDTYEHLVNGLIVEVISLQEKYENAEEAITGWKGKVERVDREIQRSYVIRDEALGHQARFARQLNAVLDLIAPEPEQFDPMSVRYE